MNQAAFLCALVLVAFTLLMAHSPAATSACDAAVHIVYVDRAEGVDPKESDIRLLASVLGGEESAKAAVLYHYTHAASGFSAKLTPQQVEDLKKQPGVLQVIRSETYHLHDPVALQTQPRTASGV